MAKCSHRRNNQTKRNSAMRMQGSHYRALAGATGLGQCIQIEESLSSELKKAYDALHWDSGSWIATVTTSKVLQGLYKDYAAINRVEVNKAKADIMNFCSSRKKRSSKKRSLRLADMQWDIYGLRSNVQTERNNACMRRT